MEKAVELAQAIKEIKDNFPAFLENMKVVAKLQRAKYNALIENGFSKEEALELCKQLY